MPDDDYLLIAGEAFEPPEEPPDVPPHAPGATAAQITETNRQHEVIKTAYKEYLACLHTSKRRILAAIDNTYLEEKNDSCFGFARETSKTLCVE